MIWEALGFGGSEAEKPGSDVDAMLNDDLEDVCIL